MMKFILLLYCTTILLPIYINCGITEAELLEDASNIDKAKVIFKSIKESNFVQTVNNVKKWGLPLMKSVASLAKVITSFIETESKEMIYLKEQFQIINNKMDIVDQEFSEVKKLIDWNVIKIQYSKFEMVIDLLQDQIQDITNAEVEIRPILIEKFIMNYEQLFNDAVYQIYAGFINENKIYTDNLIVAVRKYTKDFRSKIEKFFLGNIQLLMKGITVQTTYMEYKNYSETQKAYREYINDRMNTMFETMNKTLDLIKGRWLEQSREDIEEFTIAKNSLSHQNYVDELNKLLSQKWPERDWLIVAYDPLTKSMDHYLKNCDKYGTTLKNSHGRNIVINSIAANSNTGFDKQLYSSICSRIPTMIPSWGHGICHTISTKYTEKFVNCQNVQLAVIVRSKSVKAFSAPPNHLSICRWSGYYNRFVDIHKTLDILYMG